MIRLTSHVGYRLYLAPGGRLVPGGGGCQRFGDRESAVSRLKDLQYVADAYVSIEEIDATAAAAVGR